MINRLEQSRVELFILSIYTHNELFKETGRLKWTDVCFKKTSIITSLLIMIQFEPWYIIGIWKWSLEFRNDEYQGKVAIHLS